MLDTGSIPVEGTKFAFTGKIEAMRIFQREPASVHIFPAIFLTASVALGLPLTAGAQDTSIGIAPNATTTKTTADPTQLVKASPFRFELEVDAPEKIKVFLLRHMELQQFKDLPDLDALELSRLLLQVPDNVRNLLGTQGYFGPVITVSQTRQSQTTQGTQVTQVVVRVDPGPATRITAVDIGFDGDIALNTQAGEQRNKIEQTWSLKAGESFSQSAWDAAKSAAVRELTSQRYPTGRISQSLADIDPKDHTARLQIKLDSGNLKRWGQLNTEGIERYDPSIVKNLVYISGVVTGEEYDLEKLQDAQQRISDSGYFDSVFMFANTETGEDALPVTVQVRETKLQRLVLGIGGSTDSGLRLTAEHTHHLVPGLGWRAKSKLSLENKDKSISTDLTSTPNPQGWQWLTGALAAQQMDGDKTTNSQRLRFGRSQLSTENDRSFFLQYDRANITRPLGTVDSDTGVKSSITANHIWTRRRFDNVRSPSDGYGISVEVGAGYTLGQERRPFIRLYSRNLFYWSLDKAASKASTRNNLRSGPAANDTPGALDATNFGRVALRLEAGGVFAKADAPVPDTQLFLTGGDTTVRGYSLRSIGITDSTGAINPGRFLTVASLEWQRPVLSNNEVTPFESLVFIDAGAVSDATQALSYKVGVGVGARYNSPAGPIQAAIAYGVQSKKLRLHLNVGFTF